MPFLPRDPAHHTAEVVALHRATLENPLDDTPHLVYADAMDDAGAHEEAHTLRRLVKLRAAVGGKAVMTPSSHVSGSTTAEATRKYVPGAVRRPINERDVADLVASNTPHVRLPDVIHARRFFRSSPGPVDERVDYTHTNRRLHFSPETGDAVVDAGNVTRHYQPRTGHLIGEGSTYLWRTTIHPDTVKHLLGEPDAV